MECFFPVPTKRATKKGLLIGCNYLGSARALKGCIGDVKKMGEYYKSKGFEDLRLITDSPGELWPPTVEGIRKGFKWLLSDLEPGDACVLHYSGHGIQHQGGLSIAPKDYLKKGFISSKEISGYLYAIPEDINVFAAFDACHSASLVKLRYTYADLQLHEVDVPITKSNIIMISGCKDSQVSIDGRIDGEYQGAMTWAFLESIKKTRTWHDLIYTMRKLLEIKKFSQIPQLSCGKLVDIHSNLFIFF